MQAGPANTASHWSAGSEIVAVIDTKAIHDSRVAQKDRGPVVSWFYKKSFDGQADKVRRNMSLAGAEYEKVKRMLHEPERLDHTRRIKEFTEKLHAIETKRPKNAFLPRFIEIHFQGNDTDTGLSLKNLVAETKEYIRQMKRVSDTVIAYEDDRKRELHPHLASQNLGAVNEEVAENEQHWDDFDQPSNDVLQTQNDIGPSLQHPSTYDILLFARAVRDCNHQPTHTSEGPTSTPEQLMSTIGDAVPGVTFVSIRPGAPDNVRVSANESENISTAVFTSTLNSLD